MRDLPNGAGINITAAKYLTPNGSDIHKKGIPPHYKVELSKEDIKDKKGPWFGDYENIMEQKKDFSKDLQLMKAKKILTQELVLGLQ